MFIPKRCPRSQCPNHQAPKKPGWYHKNGYYITKAFGKVQKFKCKTCKRGFSSQTFSINYFAKRKLNYRYIYRQINTGAGIRSIARHLDVKPEAISNRIKRMARNAILINQAAAMKLLFKEDLVIDGIENFCVSQYFPDNCTIMVGKDSQFVYDCDYACLRRKGRMTPGQRAKRTLLEKQFKPSPKAVEHSLQRLLRIIDETKSPVKRSLTLYTDEKKDYKRVLSNNPSFRDHLKRGEWKHHCTSSKLSRNFANPLFAVNYMDRLIRKDMATHVRETMQFPRNVANLMSRMNLYIYDHNFIKPYRVKEADSGPHVEMAGMEREDIARLTKGFFQQRYFPESGLRLSPSALRTLHSQWETPLKKSPEKHWQYLGLQVRAG